ncbi:hypothetical protein [Alteromonas stellipolaris]|uniref:DUF1571 domain-containing protein n=1 Tax=Alteromonas stellipolaris TaxID=233316 RepID=A0AAW7Z584_9ALTE|nr:hypothetical protein [Alteromonas stellipolaris]ANB20150.1 hypothetical protein A6K25_01935 [Alteromonas stellipolaris]MDO6579681.1 hypothetical protein [Alteromonas stellipolaris]
MEYLTDWKFWSAFIALIALVLSQLPPIHILIRRPKLELEAYQRIFINHKIGSPNLQCHLIIRNAGRGTIRIKGIQCCIKRDGKEVMSFPAQNYIVKPSENQWVLFTGFELNPLEEWSHTLQFFNFAEREDEKLYQQSEINLKNEIARIKEEKGEKFFAIASDSAVKPFLDMFEKHFCWLPGDYSMEISVITNDPKVTAVASYRFTLFESQSETLKEHKLGYPSGAAIYWESQNYLGQWINIEEKSG